MSYVFKFVQEFVYIQKKVKLNLCTERKICVKVVNTQDITIKVSSIFSTIVIPMDLNGHLKQYGHVYETVYVP